MGLINRLIGRCKRAVLAKGLDKRFVEILKVERDICHLYHLLTAYEDAPDLFPHESLDFESGFTLPYWEYLDIDLDEVDLARRDFLREGCLVMIYELAYASTDPLHAHLRPTLSLCRQSIGEMDLGVQRTRDLAAVVLDAITLAEEPSPRLTNSRIEDAHFVFYEYVIPYFRRRGRHTRTPPFFKENDPVKALRQKMDWHAREAKLAYDRLYRAPTAAEATAAYSDCKDHMSDAIALADNTGLEEKANELRGQLEHYKSVFRSQFG